MDHLPTPLDASPPFIEIPLVADIPWDNLDFNTFPARHGFAVDDFGHLLLDEIGVDRIASLLQSWLYFGFLAEILEIDVCKKNFCRTTATGPVLDTTGLEELIIAKTAYNKSFFHIKSKEPHNKRKEYRCKLQRVWQVFVRITCHSITTSHPLPQILVSIEALCHTLEYLAYDRNEHSYLSSRRRFQLTIGSARLISCQMIKS